MPEKNAGPITVYGHVIIDPQNQICRFAPVLDINSSSGVSYQVVTKYSTSIVLPTPEEAWQLGQELGFAEMKGLFRTELFPIWVNLRQIEEYTKGPTIWIRLVQGDGQPITVISPKWNLLEAILRARMAGTGFAQIPTNA